MFETFYLGIGGLFLDALFFFVLYLILGLWLFREFFKNNYGKILYAFAGVLFTVVFLFFEAFTGFALFGQKESFSFIFLFVFILFLLFFVLRKVFFFYFSLD